MRISLSAITSSLIERFIKPNNPEDNIANAILSQTDNRYEETITLERTDDMRSLSLGSGKEVTIVEKEREAPEIKPNLDRDICSEELRNEVLYQNKLGEVILREDQYINRNGLICEKNKENEEHHIYRSNSELNVKDYFDILGKSGSTRFYHQEYYNRDLEQRKQERQEIILNSTPRELSLRINERESERYFDTKDITKIEHPIKDLLQEKYDPSRYTKEQQERIERDETLQRPFEYVYRVMSYSEFKQLIDGKEVARCNYLEFFHSFDKFCFFPKTPAYEDRANSCFSGNRLMDKDMEIKLPVTFRVVNEDFYRNLTYSQLGYSRLNRDPCFDKEKETRDGRPLFAQEFHMDRYSLRELCPVRIGDKDIENVKIRDILNYFENRCGEPAFKIPNEIVGKGEASNNLFYNTSNNLIAKEEDYLKGKYEDYR